LAILKQNLTRVLPIRNHATLSKGMPLHVTATKLLHFFCERIILYILIQQNAYMRYCCNFSVQHYSWPQQNNATAREHNLLMRMAC